MSPLFYGFSITYILLMFCDSVNQVEPKSLNKNEQPPLAKPTRAEQGRAQPG